MSPNPDRETTELDPLRASSVTLAILTHPGQANAFGKVHGGVILRLADECGAAAAMRHATADPRSLCVTITTAAIDSLTFLAPVFVGERVELIAEVTHAGRTSLEARLEVYAEPMGRAQRRKVGMGYGLYVALDADGKPCRVPPLLSTTDADRRRDEAARARQAERLARRDQARQAGDHDTTTTADAEPT